MNYFFTSESVGQGHPDKVADQISDAVLDQFLAYDENARVACETLVTTGQVVIAGEVRSKEYVDLQQVARDTINKIGYTKSEYQFDGDSCGILNAIHEQSEDIAQGVDNGDEENQGAGDIGIMFGYAVNETETYMPLPSYLAHMIVKTLDEIRHEGKVMTYLRPDSKAQVTVEYDGETNNPVRIDNIVVCVQHDEFDTLEEYMQRIITEDIKTHVFGRMYKAIQKDWIAEKIANYQDFKLLVNPTGKFVIGGPHGDTGLTGRKIIVDTYGGKGAHGGGAFSGKDSSKVDRSAAYAARHIAKNMVAAGISDEILVQVSYAIGKSEPMSIYVNTYGKSHVDMDDGEIAEKIGEIFDLRPKAIERRLKLRQPMYSETSAYGHMGRKNEIVTKKFTSRYHETKEMNVELFTWEKLDYVDRLKEEFGL
jgi:S-adenosylmethionine synthetase